MKRSTNQTGRALVLALALLGAGGFSAQTFAVVLTPTIFDEALFGDAGSPTEGPLAIIGGGLYDEIHGSVGGNDTSDAFIFWWDGGIFTASLSSDGTQTQALSMSLFAVTPIPIPIPALLPIPPPGPGDSVPIFILPNAIAVLPIPPPNPLLGTAVLPVPPPLGGASFTIGGAGLVAGAYLLEVAAGADPPFTIIFNSPISPLPISAIRFVPEPGTALLLLSGGLVFGTGWRRRRRSCVYTSNF